MTNLIAIRGMEMPAKCLKVINNTVTKECPFTVDTRRGLECALGCHANIVKVPDDCPLVELCSDSNIEVIAHGENVGIIKQWFEARGKNQ